jgi:HK97 family phage major capsid protein
MTSKHKELLARFDVRKKELDHFIAEKGDNITDADFGEADKIKTDLIQIRSLIDIEKQVNEKLMNLRDEAAEFDRYMNEPAAVHRHNGTQVVGAKSAGTTVIKRRGDGGRSLLRRHMFSNGDGIFGKSVFEAIKTREYKDAFIRFFKGTAKPAHYRTLEEGSDPQGGFLAPIETLARLIERKPSPTRVAGLVDVVDTSRDAVSLPRVNYTGSATDDPTATIYSTGFRATLTDENPTNSTQSLVNDTNIFGAARVSVYTWLIQGVLTNNMIEDAMFDPMAWMGGKFVETIDLLKDNMLINGTGAGQPTGMLANPGGSDTLAWLPYVASGTAAAPFITPDSLVTLSEQIPEQYDENIKYLYCKTTSGPIIRTIKDGAGRYMFGQGVQDSGLTPKRPKEINGYPVIWSQFMPTPVANAYPVIAGDFMGTTLVNRIGFSIQILREIAAQKNQVVILGRVRFGCQPLEPWRLRAYRCSAS